MDVLGEGRTALESAASSFSKKVNGLKGLVAFAERMQVSLHRDSRAEERPSERIRTHYFLFRY